MPVQSAGTAFRACDGLRLVGTLVTPDVALDRVVVLVHGGGVTREEGGFFTRLAAGLGEAGVASLRFDLRGHGESEGRQEDLTLSAVLNDIRAAIAYIRGLTGAGSVSLLGISFAGGITGYFAAKCPGLLSRVVMLNPLLNYRKRFIDDKPYWSDDQIDDGVGRELAEQGFVAHSPTFKLGRSLLNEVFWLLPHTTLGEITVPTLIVHGTGDTFISVESSRAAAAQLTCEHKLVEIDGAQHGFAVHDDSQYLDPQTREWQAFVIGAVIEWVTAGA